MVESTGAQLYRIALRYDGQDKRDRLRENDKILDEDCEAILVKLDRIDRKFYEDSFSLRILNRIEAQPDVPAATLAVQVDLEKGVFKAHVRKLKEHGLTESRAIGYRISPRGKRVLQYALVNARL